MKTTILHSEIRTSGFITRLKNLEGTLNSSKIVVSEDIIRFLVRREIERRIEHNN